MTINNLKKIREEKGLTQKELAKLSKISERQIISIENNSANPRYSTICKLVQALHTKVEEIFPLSQRQLTGEGEPDGNQAQNK